MTLSSCSTHPDRGFRPAQTTTKTTKKGELFLSVWFSWWHGGPNRNAAHCPYGLSESRSNVALDLPPPIRITHTGTHTHYPYVLPIRPYAHTRTHTTHPYYSPILPIRTTHTPIRVPIPRTHTTTRFTHAGHTTHPVWVTGMGNRYG